MDQQSLRKKLPGVPPSSSPHSLLNVGLIARLYPKLGRFPQAVINQNQLRYREPSSDNNTTTNDIPRAAQYKGLPYLELNFAHPPKYRQGFIFGHSPEHCDVVLEKHPGTDAVHFMIGYSNNYADSMYRLIIRDLGSQMGTIVSYGMQGSDSLSNTLWTVTGFSLADTSSICITLQNGEEYVLVPQVYNTRDPRVIHAITHYSTQRPEFLLSAAASGEKHRVVRSGMPDMAVERQVMECKRGFTRKVWDVTTVQAFALKRVTSPHSNEQKNDWIVRVRRFESLRHENIISVAGFKPQLQEVYLPWKPLGNIDSEFRRASFQFGEVLVLFRQCLSALDYLHRQNPPLAHKNLRPENILVHSRGARCEHSQLHVQLSDFGILETRRVLTDQRALQFKAPEILARADRSRRQFIGTPASDIWTLGTILLQVAYNRLVYNRVKIRDLVNYSLYLHEMVYSWHEDELVHLVRQCIHYLADARARAGQVLADLNGFIKNGRLTYDGPEYHACLRARIQKQGQTNHHAHTSHELYNVMREDEEIFHEFLQEATARAMESQGRREAREQEDKMDLDSDSFDDDDSDYSDDDDETEEQDEYVQWTDKVAHSSQGMRRRRRASSNLLKTIWEQKEGGVSAGSAAEQMDEGGDSGGGTDQGNGSRQQDGNSVSATESIDRSGSSWFEAT
ncbi:hypothetical protein BROUX41_002392 [Berkeleyomyces rouxiae]|uniref:uncharacterized protein n=1 Tax=Berkeleyomyces rouxiae TaxID=2035830 RepID=UPI003B826469